MSKKASNPPPPVTLDQRPLPPPYYQGMTTPIPLLLNCPACHFPHVDQADPENDWYNPPHKSHLCHECGEIWRPADVPTTGVSFIHTRGKADTWPKL